MWVMRVKRENMKGIITCNVLASWLFNRTLSIYGKKTFLKLFYLSNSEPNCLSLLEFEKW